MGDTSIQWTDKTWNPVTGCTKVSPGCAHCYAEAIATRLWPTTYANPWPMAASSRPRRFTDVRCHDERLLEPLSWRKASRVFVNSMSDLFHEDVPDDFIDKVFAVMALAERHTFQVLTKRPERMRAYAAAIDLPRLYAACRLIPERNTHAFRPQRRDLPLPNVWLGVSVENQRFADERIPPLVQTPAAVRFISAEPLLGPIDLTRWNYAEVKGHPTIAGIKSYWLDWVIVGGESGPGARPFDLAWARSIVQQCQAAGVPVFVKQLGARPLSSDTADNVEVGRHVKDRKGGDMAEWPDDIRVREFPDVPRETSETSRV